LIYQGKDYSSEVEYVDTLIKNEPIKIKTILDLGCGTGRHDELLCNKGYVVHGVDISEEMLKVAETRRKNIENKLVFNQSDITKLELNQKFDAVISLFHVMSYQISNKALDEVFSRVKDHLNDGGIFIFDFWYGPAVLTDPPKTTTKKLEDEFIKIKRTAESQINVQKNTVDVRFDILVENKKDYKLLKKKELHKMRYFFDTELELLCDKNSFHILEKYKWLSFDEPGLKTWNVVWVIKK
tara:strand:- start:10251 stop:10970 length:720 start_codon:yes stop_codon:yes gene_type:complete